MFRHMSNADFHEFERLLDAYMAAAKLTDASLSKSAGRSPDYVNKLRKRQSMPKTEYLMALAAALGVRPENLMPGAATPTAEMLASLEAQHADRKNQLNAAENLVAGGPILPKSQEAGLPPSNAAPAPPLALSGASPPPAPIYGSAHGGDGTAVLHRAEVIEYRRRPEKYEHVKDLYGFYVVGDSMLGLIPPGALVWVHPGRQPDPHDLGVFIRRGDPQDDQEILVKSLVKSSAREWTVRQVNPAREFTLPKAEWDARLVLLVDMNK